MKINLLNIVLFTTVISLAFSVKIRKNQNSPIKFLNDHNKIDENNQIISFLQTDSRKIVDPNKLFEDALACDDKFDPNLNKPRRITMDLNNVSKISEKDIDRKLMEDLQSEKISYKFD